MLIGPALINAGLSPIASHLFFLYWGMLSFITPPVCLSVYAACGISKSTVMKTGYQAMRLALVGFIIPFFFVLNPSLIAQGSLREVVYNFCPAVVGVVMLGGGLERYMIGLGRLGWWSSLSFFASGVLLMHPDWRTDLLGLALMIATSLMILIRRSHLSASLHIADPNNHR
jgi:TRAP-type uncharacterized transport system fused permease subunit